MALNISQVYVSHSELIFLWNVSFFLFSVKFHFGLHDLFHLLLLYLHSPDHRSFTGGKTATLIEVWNVILTDCKNDLGFTPPWMFFRRRRRRWLSRRRNCRRRSCRWRSSRRSRHGRGALKPAPVTVNLLILRHASPLPSHLSRRPQRHHLRATHWTAYQVRKQPGSPDEIWLVLPCLCQLDRCWMFFICQAGVKGDDMQANVMSIKINDEQSGSCGFVLESVGTLLVPDGLIDLTANGSWLCPHIPSAWFSAQTAVWAIPI